MLIQSLEEKNTLVVRFPTSNYARVLVQGRMDFIQFESRGLTKNVIFSSEKNEGDTHTCKVMFLFIL
jgi:hypothetical protein